MSNTDANGPCLTHTYTHLLKKALSKHASFVIFFSILQGNTIYLRFILFNISGHLCYLLSI